MVGSTMKGKRRGGKKSDSFYTEGWLEEGKKAVHGDFYHPGDEGLVRSLLNDVGEMVKDDVEEVKEAMSAVGDAVDAVDTVGETVKDVTGVAVDGVSKVKHAAEAAYRNGGDGVAAKVADAAGEAIETTADMVGDVGASATESLIYVVVEELAEEVMDVIPIYGLCMGAWRLAWGSAYAVTGAASVATGAAIGAVGTVAGAAASPWDGGKLFRDSVEVAGSSASWGGSVIGEGTSGVVRGACNVVGQVPGT